MKKIARRICIVSDIVLDWGGAESVLFCLLELYPQADLYTLLMEEDARNRLLKRFPHLKIFTSPFQILSKHKKLVDRLSFIKLVCWLYWELLNLNEYDMVISLSHSFGSKAIKTSSNQFHYSYVLSPPKYLYQMYSETTLPRDRFWSWLISGMLSILRRIDLRGGTRPNLLVAISRTVARRIREIYHRDCEVIYPPVKIPITTTKRAALRKYYLCLSRLVKQKGIDLAVRTCTRYKLPLLVVGDGPELDRLKNIAGETVVFHGACLESEKRKIYGRAKALIYPSIDEDFGIVPIEAMARGIPVIAYYSGGVRETVVKNTTGVFFYRHTQESLKKAINVFEGRKFEPNACIERSKIFSEKRFKKEFPRSVSTHYKTFLLCINSHMAPTKF